MSSHNNYLKFTTAEEGQIVLAVLKMEWNTYYHPIDFELIGKIKTKIKELSKK